MKPTLFLASIRDSWKSIVIFSAVLFGFGLMMMAIYPSMGDMAGDPMAEGEDILLSEIGEDDNGTQMFNLSWDFKMGAGYHMALGVESLDNFNDSQMSLLTNFQSSDIVVNQQMFDMLIANGSVLEEEGVEIIFHGVRNWVEFTWNGRSTVFFVVYMAGGGNYTPVNMSAMVTSMDLIIGGDFEEWMESPFVEGFLGRTDIDFFSIEGFTALEFFSMWPMFLLIYIGIKAGGVVAPHVEDKSLDILLATGYSRNRFLGEKLGVLGLNLGVVLIASFLGLFVGVLAIGETIDMGTLLLTFAASIPVSLAFIGIGMVFSVIFDEGMKCTWALIGIIVGMYIIQIITNIMDSLWSDILGYFSIFNYYDAVSVMFDKTIGIPDLVVPLVVGVVCIVGAFYLFNKKEIHA